MERCITWIEPNGYKVWDVSNEKFVVVRDVIVDETNFLKLRPGIELKEKENRELKSVENETDASDVESKSVKVGNMR